MKIERLQSLSDEISKELLNVWERSVRSSHHFLKEEDIAYFKPLVQKQYLPAVQLFIARNPSGRITGFMGLSGDMLEMLFILPEEQGNGYGKALVDYAVRQCRVYKVDVNEDNAQACRFYAHMGYRVVGRDEHDAFGKPFPILHLQHSTPR